MAITRKKHLYEILVRFDEDGAVKGAHQCHQEVIRDGKEVLAVNDLGAEAIDIKAVEGLLGAKNAETAERMTRVRKQLADLEMESPIQAARVDELNRALAMAKAENKELKKSIEKEE